LLFEILTMLSLSASSIRSITNLGVITKSSHATSWSY